MDERTLTRAQLMLVFAKGPAGEAGLPLVEEALSRLGWADRQAFQRADMAPLTVMLAELARDVAAAESPQLAKSLDPAIARVRDAINKKPPPTEGRRG